MMTKRLPIGSHHFKRRQPDNPLEATFAAKTAQEADATANQWLAENVPQNWKRDLNFSAGFQSRTPGSGKKAGPDKHLAQVKIFPPAGADPEEVARVRAAIAQVKRA